MENSRGILRSNSGGFSFVTYKINASFKLFNPVYSNLMNFLKMALAMLSLFILSEKVQAQNLYLKATKSGSGEVITTGASPNEAPGVLDARSGSPAPVLVNYATLSSVGFDTEQTLNISAQGAGAGTIAFKPFTISKKGDLSSAKFFLAQCRGDLMTIEIISIAVDGGQNRNVAHKIILRNAAVKTFTTDITADCSCQQETLSFEYGSLEIYPYSVNNAGKFSAIAGTGWNRLANTPANL